MYLRIDRLRQLIFEEFTKEKLMRVVLLTNKRLTSARANCFITLTHDLKFSRNISELLSV